MMNLKMGLKLSAWLFVAGVVLYASVHPEQGVIYHNPLACLGLALIGLGVCVQSRRALLGEA
ncbi:hypothetical protein ACERK3_08925 [Phycisphaerales bacterium AB-hyl4]|uniref:Uncharacterized protein n=1 Tax=Natronomicrosphaera hydrolytica TaxID=3242702 RepID=A0ABV4U820_9BACT